MTLIQSTMKVGVFVIAYNAERHIEQTLGRIPPELWDLIAVVYVVDDCSTDDTVEKALEFSREQRKVVVIRNPINRMYGGNQKIGYQFALDCGLDVVVMLHADGQYAPEYLAEMLKPIVDGRADVVIGSRMLTKGRALRGGMPLYKFVGNIILTRLQNMMSGMKLSEFHSGYRAYNVEFLRRVPFWEYSDDWHFDTEILLGAHAATAKIQEVPIPTFYGNEICRVNGIAYALHCLVACAKYYLFRKGIFYSTLYEAAQGATRYEGHFEDPFSSHSKILAQLEKLGVKDKTVLEVGAGDASLARQLQQRGAIVDIVERDAESCRRAVSICRQVYQQDLDAFSELQVKAQYDIVIMADVLEHLKDPELVVARAKKLLKKGGALIVSLPNVANIYVRLNLLLGRFPYQSKGILDRTHLRFFTLATMEEMLHKTGWVVIERDVTPIPLSVVFPFMLRPPWRHVLAVVHVVTLMWKRLLGYQGLFVCVNPNAATLL